MKWMILLLGLLSSCNFKPAYQRPCMEVPTTWRFDKENDQNDSANIRWWEQLGDPVLNELILTALQNNQDLQVASARVLQFYAQYRVVASALLPEIDLGASYLREELSNAISFAPLPPGTRVNNLYNLALTLSYEIDFWGQVRNATEAALAQYLGVFEARRTVILTLVSSLATAYVQLRQFDTQLKISQMTYESRLEALRIATLRYEVGLTSEMEMKQAESEAQSALVSVKMFEEIIPQQEDLISVLLGEPSEPIARGLLLDKLQPPISVPAGLPSDLLINRPDILQAELAIIAANAEIGVARAAFFPTISLTGLYGAESTSLRNLLKNRARMWNIGLSALEPLFTGWRITNQLREAEAIKVEAIHAYQQVVLTAFQEVNDALIAFQKNKEIVEVQKKQVAALEVYLKLAILRYNNGQNDYLTVIDAERFLFRAQLDLAQSEGNVFVALFDLYKALGGGWVIDADKCLTEGIRNTYGN